MKRKSLNFKSTKSNDGIFEIHGTFRNKYKEQNIKSSVQGKRTAAVMTYAISGGHTTKSFWHQRLFERLSPFDLMSVSKSVAHWEEGIFWKADGLEKLWV